MSKALDYAKAVREAGKKQPNALVLDSKMVAKVDETGGLQLLKQWFDVKEALALAHYIRENYGE